jgi:hypothetical protein
MKRVGHPLPLPLISKEQVTHSHSAQKNWLPTPARLKRAKNFNQLRYFGVSCHIPTHQTHFSDSNDLNHIFIFNVTNVSRNDRRETKSEKQALSYLYHKIRKEMLSNNKFKGKTKL